MTGGSGTDGRVDGGGVARRAGTEAAAPAAGAPTIALRPAEVGPFLARLIRLDPAAVVRLRGGGGPTVTLWGRVPWQVLVARTVPGTAAVDATVSAEGLLDRVSAGVAGLPGRRDGDWRWPVPPPAGEPVESVPAADLIRLGAAAAQTLREAHGRMGERVLRDALLDHVAIVVDAGGRPVEVRQSLVQAVLRMGFLATDGTGDVTIRTVGNWVGLTAEHGEVWHQNAANFAIHIVR